MSGYRVALLTDSSEVGGAEVVLRTLVQHLPAEVCPVVLATHRGVLDAITADRSNDGAVVAPGLRSALAALHRVRPDVVHANLTTFTSCRTLVIASLLLRLPVVLVDHLPTPGLSWRGRLLQRALTHLAADRVSVGEGAARLVERFGGPRPHSVRVIANGVPVVSAPPPPPAAAECVLGFLGRLEEQKGVDVALRALVGVPGARLIVMGSGRERLRLQALADGLGLSGRVELRDGSLDTRGFWSQIDVLVLPSRAEGMPLVLLEALQHGRPVVATDVGSVAEVVTPDVGVLVEPDDVTGLQAAIRGLVDDPAARLRLGARARAVAVGHWSAQRMADDYDGTYRRALRRRSAAG